MKQSYRGIKVGDKVRIIKSAETNERGWENSWVSPEMDEYVGTVQTVCAIKGTNVYFDGIYGGALGFPWFVLEVVK